MANQRCAIMENGRPRFAQNVERIGGKWVANPTEAQLREGGFRPYIDEFPIEPPGDGYHWEKNGWDDRGDAIVQLYHAVQDPTPPPRTFSKLRIVAALKAAGVWDAVKQYIIDADLYDLFLAAQDFAEDNREFDDGKKALQTALGWSDAQVEEILKAAAEGGD